MWAEKTGDIKGYVANQDPSLSACVEWGWE
jgi:hypothetical protein